jgi:hypothetical protein
VSWWWLIVAGLLVLILRYKGFGLYSAIMLSLPGAMVAFFGWNAAPIYRAHYALMDELRPIDAGSGYRSAVRMVLQDERFAHVPNNAVKRVTTKDGPRLEVDYDYEIRVSENIALELSFSEIVDKTRAEQLARR